MTVRPSNPDEATVLKYLKDLVTTGDQKLDGALRAIAEAAQRRTGASGAAVAMWKNGAMVCRARSGETAPPLGAKLSSETGISGECLRTGQTQSCTDTENDPRVDVEVCRSLGLRSIAVLPIQGWRGINGILEVFATEPGAFNHRHLDFLQQLAAIAERARATQPHGASAVVSTPVEEPQTQGLLPASDRVLDVAAAFLGHRSRPLVLGGVLLAMFLLGLVIWLGWHGPTEVGQKLQSIPSAISKVEAARPQGNDANWKPNAAGESQLFRPQKTPAGIPVKMASKIDVISEPKTEPDQPLLTADAATISAIPQQAPARAVEEMVVVEPPSIPPPGTEVSALGPVLDSPVSAPQLSNTAVSQGVTSGHLLQRVSPTYPPQALLLRVEGRVIVDATIFEDGSVHDVKVVRGNPVLARSAVEAVGRWRYKPFELNGRPVQTKTTITIDFKMPGGETAQR